MNRLLGVLMPGASLRARHVSVRNATVVKSQWAAVVTGIFEPFLYLLSVGVGVSVLVGDIVVDGRTYDYTTFVAPAMLASAAMSGAIAESTYNTYGKFKWHNTYEAMTATPLTPGDIAFGELLYSQARGSAYSFIFWCSKNIEFYIRKISSCFYLKLTFIIFNVRCNFLHSFITGIVFFNLCVKNVSENKC